MSAKLIVALLATVMPAALAAQTSYTRVLRPGTRVRVAADCETDSFAPGRAPSPNRRDRPERCAQYEGTLAHLSADSMMLVVDQREVAVAHSSIRRVEVRNGTRGHSVAGAAIGAGLGFAVGFAASATTDCSDDFLQGLCQTSQIAGPFVAGALGAGLGALIGVLVRSDRWDAVPLRVAATPSLRVGLAMGF